MTEDPRHKMFEIEKELIEVLGKEVSDDVLMKVMLLVQEYGYAAKKDIVDYIRKYGL